MGERIKVVLHDSGADVETVWAEVDPDALTARLDNVPFLHAKPTFDDVVRVEPGPDGRLAWDRRGMSYEEIVASLVSDGGRYVVIVDYVCADTAAFPLLTSWMKSSHDFEAEGAHGPQAGRPGRLYVAVREGVPPGDVMSALAGNGFRFEFTLVHPVDD